MNKHTLTKKRNTSYKSRIRYNFYCDKELYINLKMFSLKNNVGMPSLVDVAIEEFLNKRNWKYLDLDLDDDPDDDTESKTI